MLVLTRKVGDKIMIGDDIVVEVRRIQGRWCQLSIEAPKSVKILRTELLDAAKNSGGPDRPAA